MSSEELERWAKTAEFPDAIRWGEIEARILSEPIPSPEELEAEFPEQGRVRTVLMTLLSWLFLLPVVLPTMGSSVVGLVLVAFYVGLDNEPPGDWAVVVQIIFGISVLIAAFPLYMWWGTRRRGWENLGLSGVTALASAGSVVLLGSTTNSLSGIWPLVAWLALIAAVVALVEFCFFLLFAKPPPRRRLRERWRFVPAEEKWMQGTRAVVLEQFSRRKMLNDADSTAMMQLPPGAWQELESLPDGRVVRRL